jgi:hypothetical protein
MVGYAFNGRSHFFVRIALGIRDPDAREIAGCPVIFRVPNEVFKGLFSFLKSSASGVNIGPNYKKSELPVFLSHYLGF